MCSHLVALASAVMQFSINGGGSLTINKEDYKSFSLTGYPNTCRQIQVIFPLYSGMTLSSTFTCESFASFLFNKPDGVRDLGCVKETVAGEVAFRVMTFDPN